MRREQTFSRKEHLRRGADFDRAFQCGRRASDTLLTVYVIENGLGYSRLGRSVGRRVGNAVARNRVRRRLAEAFRRNKARLSLGTDFVCVVKPAAAEPGTDLAASMIELAARAAGRRSTPGPDCKDQTS